MYVNAGAGRSEGPHMLLEVELQIFMICLGVGCKDNLNPLQEQYDLTAELSPIPLCSTS